MHRSKFVLYVCWEIGGEFAISQPDTEEMSWFRERLGVASPCMLMVKIVYPFYVADLQSRGQAILLGNPLKTTECLAFFDSQSWIVRVTIGNLRILISSRIGNTTAAHLCKADKGPC